MHLRIPGVTKREKTCFQGKKSRFFDKLIIKNVQNELPYKKLLKLIEICNNNYINIIERRKRSIKSGLPHVHVLKLFWILFFCIKLILCQICQSISDLAGFFQSYLVATNKQGCQKSQKFHFLNFSRLFWNILLNIATLIDQISMRRKIWKCEFRSNLLHEGQ